MAKVHYTELVEDFKQNEPAAKARLREEVKKGSISYRDFDFGKLFIECFGWQQYLECRGNRDASAVKAMEHAGAVTTAAFQSISGQIVYSMTMEPYQSPDFKFTQLIPTRQTNIDVEKIAGITPIADEVAVVGEQELYPSVAVGQTWRHGPLLRKRGFKIALTREAIFFDRTGQLETMARDGGKAMGQNREKRAVDCVVDENGGAVNALSGGHRYHYRDNSIATYGNNSGNHAWDNLQASNALVDWTDLDSANQLLGLMTDPDTAEPIVLQAKHLVCGLSLELAALRIRNATEITVTTPGYATTGNPTETKVTNPFGGRFEVVSSAYVDARLATDTHWFWGDLTKAFEYVQCWAPDVLSLGSNTQLEFDRDIVQQYRWYEMGNYSTKEPRAVIQNTVA